MSSWLRKRVVIWCALAMLLGGAQWFSSVRAQVKTASPAARTPQLAAANLLLLLAQFSDDDRFIYYGRSGDVRLYNNPVSRLQLEKIAQTKGLSDSFLEPLLRSMAKIMKISRYDGQVTEQSAEQATVDLQKSAPDSLPSVVCVVEDGGWRVDIFATYAKWFNLSDFDRDMMVAEFTGDVSPALANDPAYLPARENKRRSNCQSNLKQLGLGLMQYTQDYDEKLPPAREWSQVIQPYVKNIQVFRCPNVTDPQGFGYAFNSRLSHKSLAALKGVNGDRMVMLYETTDLRWNAYGLGEKPAFRHLDGANTLNLYGDVKWQDKAHPPQFTFQPKK